MMVDHEIFILTRDYLHDKIGITSNKGYSSVGRAPRLHVRQCFSGESIIQSNQKKIVILIEKSMSYPITFGEQ